MFSRYLNGTKRNVAEQLAEHNNITNLIASDEYVSNPMVNGSVQLKSGAQEYYLVGFP